MDIDQNVLVSPNSLEVGCLTFVFALVIQVSADKLQNCEEHGQFIAEITHTIVTMFLSKLASLFQPLSNQSMQSSMMLPQDLAFALNSATHLCNMLTCSLVSAVASLN
jgi:hypothetical protein